MFKFISTKTAKALEQSLSRSTESAKIAYEHNDQLIDQVDQLSRDLDNANQEIARMKDTMNRAEVDNSVKLIISRDMETITPIIAYRADAFEALFQAGYLNDGHQGNEPALQLALMMVASESLAQLLEAFETPIEE